MKNLAMEYVYEAHDIVPREMCQEIIEKFENDPDKVGGKINDDVVCDFFKKTTDLGFSNKSEWKIIDDQLSRYLLLGLQKYFDYLLKNVFNGDDHYILQKIFGDNINVTHFQIQRYKVGDYFKWHVDEALNIKRLLAFIIYLNDNESGTEFINGKNIKPEYGKILFFPSTWTYPHQGQEVKKGVKYVITGFICECV